MSVTILLLYLGKFNNIRKRTKRRAYYFLQVLNFSNCRILRLLCSGFCWAF